MTGGGRVRSPSGPPALVALNLTYDYDFTVKPVASEMRPYQFPPRWRSNSLQINRFYHQFLGIGRHSYSVPRVPLQFTFLFSKSSQAALTREHPPLEGGAKEQRNCPAAAGEFRCQSLHSAQILTHFNAT